MRQAVILAGGKGTRLQERLQGRPKPLVDVDGVPLLGRQLRALRDSGFRNIVVLVNHAAEQIRTYCAQPEFADLDITLLDDGEPRGTAGALLYAGKHLAERYLVVYGDTLFDIDLDRFWETHAQSGADATLFLHPNDHPFDSDLIELDDDGHVIAFHKPPHDPEGALPNLVNAALYVLEHQAVAFWQETPPPTDIARDLFPAMLGRGADIRGYVSYEYIKDIGTPDRLDKAVGHLRNGIVHRARHDQMQKAVFLDRDGTINRHDGYLRRAEDFVLIDGAADAIKVLNDNEYRVVVATNQPVIARGETSFAELRRIHGRMETLLGQKRAFVDGIYFCPHHPDGGYAGEVVELKFRCDCRKPNTGMIEKARADMNIDVSRSWFVGDTTGDLLAAQRAGLKSILVLTGEGGRDGKYDAQPDFTATDLAGAARFITEDYPAFERHAAQLAQRAAPGSVILVAGLAKQGKSAFSATLRHELSRRGLDAHIVALDGFLRDEGKRESGVLGRYDLDEAVRLLAPWLGNQVETLDASVPVYDRFARCRSVHSRPLPLRDDSVLIIEGVPALLLAKKVERPLIKVFVEGGEAARRQRVIRDLVHRGFGEKDAERIYETRVQDETPVIAGTASLADISISFSR